MSQNSKKRAPAAPRAVRERTFLLVLSLLTTLDLPDYCPIISGIKFWWFSFFLNLKTDLRKPRYQFFRRGTFAPKSWWAKSEHLTFCVRIFLRLCIWYFSVSVCVCLSLYLSLCLYFCLFFVFVFLIIFFCSLSLPADDDHHEFEPAGSKLNRSFLKWTRRARRVFGRISRISRLYFCISAEVDGAFLSPRPPERSQD